MRRIGDLALTAAAARGVLSKLDFRSRGQAVVFGHEHGLARPGR